MSSTLLMERTGMGVQGVPGLGTPTVGGPVGGPVGTNWLMVPRCTFKVEKCSGGVKITCHADDKVACSMVQNLCSMLAGGMCSCCVMYNGVTMCYYNFSQGLCKFDCTEQGVCFTCTSGDQQCCQMIQSCCEAISCCLEAGCTCCFLVNNTPVCCGYSETCKSSPKATTKK
ncbi:MAG: hypothetical protein K2R98_24140 [Gemmataceae bacterium]|nr:hypothetical protein [Gemmataceae bacterium]